LTDVVSDSLYPDASWQSAVRAHPLSKSPQRHEFEFADRVTSFVGATMKPISPDFQTLTRVVAASFAKTSQTLEPVHYARFFRTFTTDAGCENSASPVCRKTVTASDIATDANCGAAFALRATASQEIRTLRLNAIARLKTRTTM
jgi:hypothetical protein